MNRSRKFKESPGIFSKYASYYDILYQDKDYAGESLFVTEIIKKLLPHNKDIQILDLACGTGRHAIEFTGHGYRVEGSDISCDMIKIARKESKKSKLNIPFYNESFQTAGRIKKKYDVILSLFASINYLTTYKDLSAAFKNIHTLMKDEGIFIFDFWNGNAVISNFSPVRVKRMSRNGEEVQRISETTIDRLSQVATVKFKFMHIENGTIIKEFEEKHLIRYYFLQEMTDFLQANNLKVIFRCPFMNISGNVSESDWYITYAVSKMEN